MRLFALQCLWRSFPRAPWFCGFAVLPPLLPGERKRGVSRRLSLIMLVSFSLSPPAAACVCGRFDCMTSCVLNQIWSLPSQKFVCTLSGHNNWVRCATFRCAAAPVMAMLRYGRGSGEPVPILKYDKMTTLCARVSPPCPPSPRFFSVFCAGILEWGPPSQLFPHPSPSCGQCHALVHICEDSSKHNRERHPAGICSHPLQASKYLWHNCPFLRSFLPSFLPP